MINEQIQVIPLDISLSTDDCFGHFAALPYAVLLDSAGASHSNSQFDIIVSWPEHIIKANQGKFFRDEQEIVDVRSEMNELLSSYCSSNRSSLPFGGGWVGHFCYDLGRYLEKMPELAKHDIDFPDMSVGLYPDALVFSHSDQQWFYVHQPATNRLARFMAQLRIETNHASFQLSSSWTSNLQFSDYQARFEAIQAYLRSGDCYQINLAQRFCADFSGSPWLAYQTLRASNQAPFSAFINHPNGCVLSVSPERFIKVEDRKVETKPIKGTLPRGKTLQEDRALAEQLRHSPKDQAENVMIVDLLRNDLGKVAKPGSVEVPSLFAIESFPAVHHLVSTVTSELAEGFTPIDQLFAAFPGGSITGAPKIRAMEIIEELEPHRRSIYCGSIGYVSACGRMDTSITIRTLIATHDKLYCWAGGGIVADSVCQSEYEETLHKVNKILPVLE